MDTINLYGCSEGSIYLVMDLRGCNEGATVKPVCLGGLVVNEGAANHTSVAVYFDSHVIFVQYLDCVSATHCTPISQSVSRIFWNVSLIPIYSITIVS